MNVRGLKGERTKKRNGRVKLKTKGIGAIRENIILFTSSLSFYLHLRAPSKRNSQTFVGLKMSVGPSWLAISVFIHHRAMYCASVAKSRSFLILFYRFNISCAIKIDKLTKNLKILKLKQKTHLRKVHNRIWELARHLVHKKVFTH